MSLTMAVPVPVPSVAHSSTPLPLWGVASYPAKYSLLLNTAVEKMP